MSNSTVVSKATKYRVRGSDKSRHSSKRLKSITLPKMEFMGKEKQTDTKDIKYLTFDHK